MSLVTPVVVYHVSPDRLSGEISLLTSVVHLCTYESGKSSPQMPTKWDLSSWKKGLNSAFKFEMKIDFSLQTWQIWDQFAILLRSLLKPKGDILGDFWVSGMQKTFCLFSIKFYLIEILKRFYLLMFFYGF